jgi:hypothetical protein
VQNQINAINSSVPKGCGGSFFFNKPRQRCVAVLVRDG